MVLASREPRRLKHKTFSFQGGGSAHHPPTPSGPAIQHRPARRHRPPRARHRRDTDNPPTRDRCGDFPCNRIGEPPYDPRDRYSISTLTSFIGSQFFDLALT